MKKQIFIWYSEDLTLQIIVQEGDELVSSRQCRLRLSVYRSLSSS